MEHEPTEPYDGPARAGEVEVVRLRGQGPPIDGRFHWWGRIGRDPALEVHASGSTVNLEIPHGNRRGRPVGPRPWGRFRIRGTGKPPY